MEKKALLSIDAGATGPEDPAQRIVDGGTIEFILEEVPVPDARKVASILDKALDLRGLALEDAAALLSVRDTDALAMLFRAADVVKQKVFGNRVVLFAPLYLSSYCTNGCLYCGFRSTNRDVQRKALLPDEVAKEAGTLEEMGFKRVLLVLGEDPRWGVDYIIDSVRAIYRNTGIRIVHLNAPPMDVCDLERLAECGIGVYQVFQETYHRPTYRRMHPWGGKKDFYYRLSVMDRALEAGFEDAGIGALLGLYDPRFDVLATIAHSKHLYERYGTHAHTISIPRLRPALGTELNGVPYPVTDEDVKKIVAVYRLAVPTAGVVISTRESPELRETLLHCGASQISAASRTSPGGYSNNRDGAALEQFSTYDHRGLREVMASIIRAGHLPSLCTSCYRSGRTGQSFTQRTSAGEIKKFCQANALLTLGEYVEDHPENGDARLFLKAMQEGLEDIKDPYMKAKVLQMLEEIKKGKRDLRF